MSYENALLKSYKLSKTREKIVYKNFIIILNYEYIK